VDAEYFSGDDGCDGETIEYVNEGFPDFDRCASFAFVVEAVDLLAWNFKEVPLVTFAHSWLPRRRKKFSGQRIFKANSKHTVSRLCRPTSINVAGGGPLST